uniref:Uncharacterized protein n=1 Tax=Anopheles christyi TaxID=43041 RepID=A0A182K4I0_9DIPT
MESFASTTECTPEPHNERPQNTLQCLDHTIGVIWHCFDAFREQFFTASPESIEWAVDFLQSLASSSTDELHFVIAYLRCVQALVQLVCRKSRTPREATTTSIEASLRESVSERAVEHLPGEKQAVVRHDPLPQDLIDELLRLYALLARYKEDVHEQREDTIELSQLQEIEQLLQELNDSFSATDRKEETQQELLKSGNNVTNIETE